jgi:uroporphyrinogen decarboxylase
MNSRERIVETLGHGRTDRVAIDLGATNATGIHAIVYRDLKRLLGIDRGEIRVFDIIAQLARIEPEVLDRLGGDVVMVRKLAPSLGIPVRGWKPGRLTDGTPCTVADSYNPVRNDRGDLEIFALGNGDDQIHPFRRGEPPGRHLAGRVLARCPAGSHAFCRLLHPFEDVDSIESLDGYGFPGLSDEEIAFSADEARRLYETTDKALCGIFNGSVFETGQLYWGYEKFFVQMAADPDFMAEFLARRTKAYRRDLERYLDAVGRYIQVINFWDDLGTQSSLIISPKMYRTMIKPHHAELFGYVREKFPEVKVFFHTCGAVADLIPDLIDIGVQVLNPVQITAAGMDPAGLKRRFGSALSFWGGGVDTQYTLNGGTPDQVRKLAGEMLEIFATGGGYVFSQVHNIESCVPAGNVLAAFETAKTYRGGRL